MSFYNVVIKLNGTSSLNEMTEGPFREGAAVSVLSRWNRYRATQLERSCVRVASSQLGPEHRVVVTSCASHARFGVDDDTREKDGETTADDERASGRRRVRWWGKLLRRISLGVCSPGRGERAVTERDGVTKGGDANALEWDIYLLLSLSSVGVLRKRGRTDTVPMETRRRPPPKILGPSTSTRSLSRSLCHPSLTHSPLSRILTFPRSTFPPALPLFRPLSIHPSVCLRLHRFSSDPVTIPMAAFSP